MLGYGRSEVLVGHRDFHCRGSGRIIELVMARREAGAQRRSSLGGLDESLGRGVDGTGSFLDRPGNRQVSNLDMTECADQWGTN
jgi:hypothetical protein